MCALTGLTKIFSFRRFVETEISSLSSDVSGEFSEQRDIEGRGEQFHLAMEQTATLLLEFWSLFSDDKPDLVKLSEIGSRLLPLKLLVEEMWTKISRLRGDNIPKLLRIYSKYMQDVFNDKLLGT